MRGQDDDDWRTADVVEQQRQTLACSSPLGTAVTIRADIRKKDQQIL